MCGTKKWIYKTLIVLIGLLQLTQAAYLRCYNGSLDNYLATPLEHPLGITPCINSELPIVIYTFGYRGKTSGPATTAMLSAYIAKKKKNVLLLDWEEEAQSGLLGIPLGYALYAFPNAKRIGRELGLALVELTKAGVNTADIHLLGHSLGAHIMGFAGKQAREYGFVVPRITGLDPALALFEGTFALQRGLDRTCAKFVDIIHTNPGDYGSNSSSGTVDIWPNYNSSTGTQPGCPVGNFETFSPEELCSHDRSWRYYSEALASPTAFEAAGASDYNEWVANDGRTNHTIYLGDLTSTRARGNFFLRTNPQQPFGLGAKGLRPVGIVQARRRRTTLLTRLLRFL